MPTVTILEKIYGSGSPETFEKLYSDLVRGLQVQLHLVGTSDRGWIRLNISGEDETAALNLLDQKVGLAAVTLDSIRKFSVRSGNVVFSSKTNNELYVDLGISSPRRYDAVLSKNHLRAQLADGNELSLKSLVELFCLYDNVPIEVKIVEQVESENKNVDAILSDAQITLFNRWIRSRFDRLIILGAFFSDVEKAVKLSRHSRDVIKIGSLGTLEHMIICKIGTDAVGIIPKLGRYLKSAILVPFSPKKILKAIGNQAFDY
jgi:hypothetical protein